MARSWRLGSPPAIRFRQRLTPPRLLLGSFLLLIAFGTLGLKLLPGLYTGAPLRWVDALFTATSAVCVTGLIVVDTATYFTFWGQAFILLLIQLGGLGILTFTTLIILALGRRLSFHHEAVTAHHAGVAEDIDVRRLVRSIVVYTLLFEAAGALLLFVAWLPRYPTVGAAWHAVFQSISAFCNAGFSTFSDSLMGFQNAPFVLLVIMLLIVAGGLGFLTLEELKLGWLGRSEGRLRLSLHSRLVLAATAVLLVGGWGIFAALEWFNTLGPMPVWQKLLNALFMSVTSRTAGFNTVDYSSTADSTDFVTIIWMSIGGSPGSTAGGVKTTTVAVLALLALSRLRGHRVTSIWKRTIPEETIERSVGLVIVAFVVVTTAILLMSVRELGTATHPQVAGGFVRHMFETVSAFNTVGLSMGVTSNLSVFSRLLTIILMYVGRTGPLTLASAIALREPKKAGEFRYAYEDIIIG
jgi:trk system potassium uptake protein TrkH